MPRGYYGIAGKEGEPVRNSLFQVTRECRRPKAEITDRNCQYWSPGETWFDEKDLSIDC